MSGPYSNRTPTHVPFSRGRSHRRRVTGLDLQILHAPPLLAIVREPHQVRRTAGNVQTIQTTAETASFGFQHRLLSSPPAEECSFFFAGTQGEDARPLGLGKESRKPVHLKIAADGLHIHTHIPAGGH